MGDAAKKEAAFGFNPLGYRHPLVSRIPGESDPVTAGLTQALTWQYHKLLLPKGSKAEVALAFENGDPAVIEAPRHRGPGDPGGDLGRHRLDDLADPQELSPGHAADRPPGLGRPALRAEHPRRPAVRPVVPRAGASAAPVTVVTPKGQPIAAKLQPAGGVSQFHFEQTDLSGTVPGQDRAAAGARIVVRGQYRPGRERPGQARPGRAGGVCCPAGSSSTCTDWKELTEERRLGRPPRRAAPADALRRPGAPAPANRSSRGNSGIMTPLSTEVDRP